MSDVGALKHVSYRDPNLLETVDVFENVWKELATAPSKDEVERAIIGAVGSLDAPISAVTQGAMGLRRIICGDTAEERQKFRDEVMATTPADYVKFSERLQKATDKRTVVVGSADKAGPLRERFPDHQVRQPIKKDE